MTSTAEGTRDFFVSFNQADRAWATWIAWVLEEAGYTVFFQDWDFTGNFVLEMDRAHTQSRRTVAVLSPDYLTSRFTTPEWAMRFAQDATSEHDRLIPVWVRPCNLNGLLAQVVYVDLVGCNETTAWDKLLKRISGIRPKPGERPLFPGSASHEAVPERPAFPAPEPMGKHEFRFQASGEMEHVVSLLLGVKDFADERQATLFGDLRAGGPCPIDPRKQHLHIGLRAVRIRLSCGGCSPMLGFGIGDDDKNRSDIESSIRVSRRSPTLWEVTTRSKKLYLDGYLIKNAPLTPVTMYENEEIFIEATLCAYPKEIELQDLSENPGSRSADSVKMKLLKLVLRKMIGGNRDEIVLMRYSLTRKKLSSGCD